MKTQVGFNYLCNPMLRTAREMIAAGELGVIRSYRGIHAEDYMADATSPFTFRHDPQGGGARWRISAAMRWRRRNSCWGRLPR